MAQIMHQNALGEQEYVAALGVRRIGYIAGITVVATAVFAVLYFSFCTLRRSNGVRFPCPRGFQGVVFRSAVVPPWWNPVCHRSSTPARTSVWPTMASTPVRRAGGPNYCPRRL